MTLVLAMIANESTEVVNTIIADDESFKIEGFYFIPVNGKECEIGMFYNKKDGEFYYDEGFTLKTNPVSDPSQIPSISTGDSE